MNTEEINTEAIDATRGDWTIYTREERTANGPRVAPVLSITIDKTEQALLIVDDDDEMTYAPFAAIVEAMRRAGFTVTGPEE